MQEDQKFRVFILYIVSSEPALATQDYLKKKFFLIKKKIVRDPTQLFQTVALYTIFRKLSCRYLRAGGSMSGSRLCVLSSMKVAKCTCNANWVLGQCS